MRRFGSSLAVLALIAAGAAPAAPLALRGGTLVDLGDFGRSTGDIEDAVVVMDGDRIVAAGAAGKVAIPDDATVVDTRGRFIVPGLIDGFSIQNGEAQARAHLYMGVTTVFSNDGDPRRGMSVAVPNGPTIVQIGIVTGRDLSDAPDAVSVRDLRAQARRLSPADMAAFVDATRWQGRGALLLYYSLDPDQVAAAQKRANAAKVFMIGELGHTGVVEAADLGVPVFVHSNRALLDLAPAEIRKAVADQPFGPGRRAFMAFLGGLDPASDAVRAYGAALAQRRAAIMPTFALFDLSLPGHANPWREPVGAILDPGEIMLPADRETGVANHPIDPRGAEHELALHATLAQAGVKYVVGSGADAFGVLPGLGVHIEMAMLVRIGLTPRQALAAATQNFPELVEFVDYGTIRPGARADVLVLEADPTQDIRNARRIARLFVRGTEIDRARLLEQAPK